MNQITEPDKRPMCKHCGKKRSNRPRGLCWDCYYHKPGIRERYAVSSHNGAIRNPIGADSFAARPLPEEPTEATPGSEEKLLIMEQRAMRQESLFHPLDEYAKAKGPWQAPVASVLHGENRAVRNDFDVLTS